MRPFSYDADGRSPAIPGPKGERSCVVTLVRGPHNAAMPAFSISIALCFLPALTQPNAGLSAASDLPLTRYELPLSGKPVGVEAFDLDGDGTPELVAATRSPGGLAFWRDLSQSLESGGAPERIALPDYLVGPLALPPFEETPARLVVASQESRQLFVLTADDFAAGAPTPSPALELPGVPRFLCSGPNGSVYVFTRTNEIIYVGTDGFGRVTFSEHDQLCAAMQLTEVSGEFDPGEMPMMIVGSQTDRLVGVYVADPEAKSGWKVLFDFEFEGIPRAFGTADLDGDGDRELLIAGGDDVVWALGCGQPGGMNAWLEQDPLQPARHRMSTVPIALRDKWALAMSGQSVVELGLSAKGEVLREHESYAGQSPVALACTDFTGDGRADVVTANREARRVSLLLGTKVLGEGDPLRTPLRVNAGRGPSELSIVRGEPSSLLVLSALDGRWSHVGRDANGDLKRLQEAPAPPQTIALAAVHGKKRIGVAALSSAGSSGAALTFAADFQSPGALTEQVTARTQFGSSAGALLAQDLDGDGGEELLVSDPSGNRVRAFGVEGERLPLLAELELGPNPSALARGLENSFFVALAGGGPQRGVAHLARNGNALVEIERIETPLGQPLDLFLPSPTTLCVLEARGPRDGAGTLCIYEKEGDDWNVAYEGSTGFRPYAITGDANRIVVSAQNSHHLNYWTRLDESWIRRPDLGCGTGPLDVVLLSLGRQEGFAIATANAFSDDVTLSLGE